MAQEMHPVYVIQREFLCQKQRSGRPLSLDLIHLLLRNQRNIECLSRLISLVNLSVDCYLLGNSKF
jgi:hypothetical protein